MWRAPCAQVYKNIYIHHIRIGCGGGRKRVPILRTAGNLTKTYTGRQVSLGCGAGCQRVPQLRIVGNPANTHAFRKVSIGSGSGCRRVPRPHITGTQPKPHAFLMGASGCRDCRIAGHHTNTFTPVHLAKFPSGAVQPAGCMRRARVQQDAAGRLGAAGRSRVQQGVRQDIN